MRPRRDGPGRRSAGPLRSPPPATRYEARDRAPRPRAIQVPSAAATADARVRSLAGTFRMAQLHPPVQRSDTAIAGRLVEHRVTLCGVGKRLRVALLIHFESGAQHEYELVAQHLAGGA